MVVDCLKDKPQLASHSLSEPVAIMESIDDHLSAMMKHLVP